MPDIEEKVVEMKFQNKDFADGVKDTLGWLDKLKDGLKFDSIKENVTNIFDGITKASDDVDCSGLIDSMDDVGEKSSWMQAISTGAFIAIGVEVVNAAKKVLDLTGSITGLGEAVEGFNKFGDKTTSVATLVAQGYSQDEVDEALTKLNWFTDETSYSFTDMTSSIAKFTASGQDLTESVNAMMGIANWAALSGQNAQTASRAMYQLSQAMGAGIMRLEDYKSIQNASMDTAEFRQKALDAAVSLGTLRKNADGTYQTLSKDAEEIERFDLSSFTTQLTKGKWFTKDVMMKVFGEYSAAVDQIYDAYSADDSPYETTSEVIDALGDSVDAFGLKAFKSAQQAKTLTDVTDSLKDATSTVWMNIWETIFGNYEEATVLYTDMANRFYEVVTAIPNYLLDAFKGWKGKGRDKLIDAFWTLYNAITGIFNSLADSFANVFGLFDEEGNASSEWLINLTQRLNIFAHALNQILSNNETLKNVFDIFAKIVKFFADAIGDVVHFIALIIESTAIFKNQQSDLLTIWDLINLLLTGISKILDVILDLHIVENILKIPLKIITTLEKGITALYKGITKFWNFISGAFKKTKKEKVVDKVEEAGETTESAFSKVKDIFTDISDAISSAIENVKEFGKTITEKVGGALETVGGFFSDKFAPIIDTTSHVVDVFKKESQKNEGFINALWGAGFELDLEYDNGATEALKNLGSSLWIARDLSEQFADGGIRAVGEALSEYDIDISKYGEKVIRLADALDKVKEKFKKVYDFVSDKFNSAFKIAKDYISETSKELGTKFTDAIKKAITKIKELSKSVTGKLKEAFNSTKEYISGVAGNVKDYFSNLWNEKEFKAIYNQGIEIEGLGDYIADTFKWLKGNTGNGIVDFLSATASDLDVEYGTEFTGKLFEITDSLRDFRDQTKEYVAEAWTNVVTSATNIVTDVANGFADISNAIKDKYEETGSITETAEWFVSSLWKGIKYYVTKGWDTVVDFFKNLDYQGIVDTVKKEISGRANAIWEGITTFDYKGTYDNTKESIVDFFDKIRESSDKASESLENSKVGEFFSGMLDKITGAWDKFKQTDFYKFFSSAYQTLATYVSGLWGDLKAAITNAVGNTNIGEIGKQIWDTIVGVFKVPVTNVQNGTFAENLYTIFETVFNGMKKVVEWFADLPTNLSNILKAIGDWFVNNAEFFKALGESIKGFFVKVGTWISDLGKDISEWWNGLDENTKLIWGVIFSATAILVTIGRGIGLLGKGIRELGEGIGDGLSDLGRGLKATAKAQKLQAVADIIKSLGAAALEIAAATLLLASLTPEQLSQAIPILAALGGLILALAIIEAIIAKVTNEAPDIGISVSGGGLGTLVLGLAALFFTMKPLLETLNDLYTANPESAAAAMGSIVALIISISAGTAAIMKYSTSQGGIVQSLKTLAMSKTITDGLVKLMPSITLLIDSIMAAGTPEEQQMRLTTTLEVIGAMILFIGSIAGMFAALGTIDPGLADIIAIAAILGGVWFVMNAFHDILAIPDMDPEVIKTVAISIGIILGIMDGTVIALSKMTAAAIDWSIMVFYGEMILAIVGIAHTLKSLIEVGSTEDYLEAAGAISIIFGAIALAAYLMSNGGGDWKTMLLGAVAIDLMSGALIGIAYAFNLLMQNPADHIWDYFFVLVVAFAVLFAGSLILMAASSVITAALPEIGLALLVLAGVTIILIGLAYALKLAAEGFDMLVDSTIRYFKECFSMFVELVDGGYVDDLLLFGAGLMVVALASLLLIPGTLGLLGFGAALLLIGPALKTIAEAFDIFIEALIKFNESVAGIFGDIVKLFQKNTNKSNKDSIAAGSQELGDSIEEPLAGLGRKAPSWGENIINGIGSVFNGAVETVTGWGETIAGWINGAFCKKEDMNSPSKVWEDYGGYMMDGLNIGILNGETDVTSTVDDLAGSINSTFAEGLTDSSLADMFTSNVTDQIAGMDSQFESLFSDQNGLTDQFMSSLTAELGDMDLNPTITPVMDLSEITSGFGDIQSMFNTDSFNLFGSDSMKFDLSSITGLVNGSMTNHDFSYLFDPSSLFSGSMGSNFSNVFNIQGLNAGDIAKEISNIITKQQKGRTVAAGSSNGSQYGSSWHR